MAQEAQQKVIDTTYLPIVYEVDGEPVKLTVDEILAYFGRSQEGITKQEAMHFMIFCKYLRANPYLQDAHLVKYSPKKPAEFVVGYGFFLRRAEQNEHYRGFGAGLIVSNAGGEIEEVEGAFLRPDDGLLGGWCQVYRDDRDHISPVRLNLDRYVRKRWDVKVQKKVPMAMWATNAPDQIMKVAISQAHRKNFTELRGMLTEVEFQSTGPVGKQKALPNGMGRDALKADLFARLRELGAEFQNKKMEGYLEDLADASQKAFEEICDGTLREVTTPEQAEEFMKAFKSFTERKPIKGKDATAEPEETKAEETTRPETDQDPSFEEQFEIRLGEAQLKLPWEAWKIKQGLDTPEAIGKETERIKPDLDGFLAELNTWWNKLPGKEQKSLMEQVSGQ